MATVILDLDDVLGNLREALYRTLIRHSTHDRHWNDWHHYDLSLHFPDVADRLDDLLMAEATLENCEPEPGAAAATRRLRDEGFGLAVITARGWHPNALNLTRAWLESHEFAFDSLAVVPLGGDKLSCIAALESIRLAVDDHPRHIDRYRGAGIPAVMISRPWNRHHDAPRIDDLAALLDQGRHHLGPCSELP